MNTTEANQPTMCDTCVFRENSPVRLKDFDPHLFHDTCKELEWFICHPPNEDGTHPVCAVWEAYYGSERL